MTSKTGQKTGLLINLGMVEDEEDLKVNELEGVEVEILAIFRWEWLGTMGLG